MYGNWLYYIHYFFLVDPDNIAEDTISNALVRLFIVLDRLILTESQYQQVKANTIRLEQKLQEVLSRITEVESIIGSLDTEDEDDTTAVPVITEGTTITLPATSGVSSTATNTTTITVATTATATTTTTITVTTTTSSTAATNTTTATASTTTSNTNTIANSTFTTTTTTTTTTATTSTTTTTATTTTTTTTNTTNTTTT